MQAQPQTITVVVTDPREAARAQRRYNKWVNQNQWSSAAAATMLFAYGGMDMALGLNWNLYTGISNTLQFQYSWFIGVLAGAIVSAVSMTHIPKMVYYIFGGLLQLISAIIFVSAPYEYPAILAARYVGGVGIGLVTVPFIVHSSEIAASSFRGICSSVEQYGLALGIAIQVIYESQWAWSTAFPANQVHGIFGIVFAACALGSVAMSIESPIFHLRRNDEAQARACQRRLVREFVAGEASEGALAEAKAYVLEGNSQSVGISIIAFAKLLIFRCFVAFSFSVPLTLSLQLSSRVAEGGTDASWSPIVSGVLRFVGALLTVVALDRIGRKFVSLLGLLAMSALILTMAGIFANPTYVADPYEMNIVCNSCVAFQFFAGLFAPSTTTYLGEAFPMRIKPLLIGLIVATQQLVHIIVIVTFPYNTEALYVYFVTVGIIMVLGVVAFALLMPETRNTTLRQAGALFRGVHHVMSY